MSNQADPIIAAHAAACRRHPEFPGALDSMGAILAEELLEVAQAGMLVMQAINDHRDEGRPLEDVLTELRHVGAVVRRALERLEGEKA